ncbi:MAG: 2OG-Fe(II) oxygenase [Acidobacteria bacterium]|nr:2OG-Fe(II) oxygenase [Acidobacteriota bacterium]
MPRYDFRIDGRQLFVIDDVLPPARIGNLATFFDFAEARRVESDSAGGIDARSWIVPLENDVASRQPYYDAILREISTSFAGETFTLKRAYCNVVSFGDILLPHRDSSADSDVTALLFVAETWDRAWGGETIFYNDAGDAVHAVSPRPGRLVLFRSAIEHRGTPPSRLCTQTRLTLALKLTGSGR